MKEEVVKKVVKELKLPDDYKWKVRIWNLHVPQGLIMQ